MDKSFKFVVVMVLSFLLLYSVYTMEAIVDKPSRVVTASSMDNAVFNQSLNHLTVRNDTKTADSNKLKIHQSYDFGKVSDSIDMIDNQKTWEWFCRQKGRKAPDIDFDKYVIVADRQDFAESSNVEILYSKGQYLAFNRTTLGGFPPDGEFKTKFYVVERLD